MCFCHLSKEKTNKNQRLAIFLVLTKCQEEKSVKMETFILHLRKFRCYLTVKSCMSERQASCLKIEQDMRLTAYLLYLIVRNCSICED